MNEEEDCLHALCLLEKSELLESTYEASIALEGVNVEDTISRRKKHRRNKRKSEAEQVFSLLSQEIAVLRLSEKHGAADTVERMIAISRCALNKLELEGQALVKPQIPTAPLEGKSSTTDGDLFGDVQARGEEKDSIEAILMQAQDLDSLPVNVQLGIHMLLKIISALNVSENSFAMQALLKRLPSLLMDLPPLALVENPVIAREVHITENLRALGLDSMHSLNEFEKRKTQIIREQERGRTSERNFSANSSISTAIAHVLERAYDMHVNNPLQLLEDQVAQADEKLCKGDLLSALLGLSIKRGSLSMIVNCVTMFLKHQQQGAATKKSSGQSIKTHVESKETEEKERETLTTLLGAQDPENDLDIEPFLEELKAANPAELLRAFQKPKSEEIGGVLFTWGKGDHGKLGHGKCHEADPDPQPHMHEHCPDGNCTENIKLPKLVKDLEFSKIRKVASLSTHSLALTDDGVLYAWGNGDKNRLGHGTTAKEYYPRVVNALRTKPPVKDIACGLGHSLALLENGHLYSWGNGGNGRLGLGDTDDRTIATLVTKFVTSQAEDQPPSDISKNNFKMPDDIRLTGLFAGASHSMAITNDGRCFTWGKNNQGQCGHGDVTDKLHPTLVQGLCKFSGAENDSTEDTDGKVMDPNYAVVCMAGGWEHSLALTADGRLFSFGSGYKDSRRSGLPPVLGHGGTERELYPRQILALQNKKVTYCACGWDHSMAITEEGHVYTWGAGTNGKLGHGDETSQPLPKLVEALVEADAKVIQVEAGCEHSVAITDDGYMFTWGHGDSGRLGHGNNRSEKRPKRVEALVEQGLPVVHCAVGDKYNLVLTDPTAYDTYAEKLNAAAAEKDEDERVQVTNELTEPVEGKTESKESDEGKNEAFPRSSRSSVIPKTLGEALLASPCFRFPEEDDTLVPEWMLSVDRVAVFTLLQLERLASETVEAVENLVPSSAAARAMPHLRISSPKGGATLFSERQTLVIPGVLNASGRTGQRPKLPAAIQTVQQVAEVSLLAAKLPGLVSIDTASSAFPGSPSSGGVASITLPYSVETSSRGIQRLVEMLKCTFSNALQASTPGNQGCSCHQDESSPCSDCSWVSLWCVLRIIQANLTFLSKEAPMDSTTSKDRAREAALSEMHEILLKIVDHPTGTGSLSSNAFTDDDVLVHKDLTDLKDCFDAEAFAKHAVALEAASAIQVGFTRFYPTSDSRIGLLKRLLSSARQDSARARGSARHSSAVLDVLMSNLARDEAMLPLVVGMVQSDFDILELMMDLLDNIHRPTHLRLLLSMQSHTFTFWRDAAYVKSDIRSVLVSYTSEVLNRVTCALQEEQDGFSSETLAVYLCSILPPLLCTLIVTKPFTEAFISSIGTSAQALFRTMCRTKNAANFEDKGFSSCMQLLARLCGRIVCSGVIQFPAERLDPAFHEHPVLFLSKITSEESESTSFPIQLVLGSEKALALDKTVRTSFGASVQNLERRFSDDVVALHQALVAIRLLCFHPEDEIRAPLEEAMQGDGSLFVPSQALQECYVSALHAIHAFLDTVEHGPPAHTPAIRRTLLLAVQERLLNNAQTIASRKLQLPLEWKEVELAMWGSLEYLFLTDECTDEDAARIVSRALRVVRKDASASLFEPLLRLLVCAETLDGAAECAQERMQHTSKSVAGLENLEELVKLCSTVGSLVLSGEEVTLSSQLIGSLLYYLPYAVSHSSSTHLGNPEAISVKAPGSPKNDGLELSETQADSTFSSGHYLMTPLAQASPNVVAGIMKDLIKVDDSGAAILASVFLLTNANYLRGDALKDDQMALLVAALRQRLDSFYREHKDPWGTASGNKIFLVPFYEYVFRALTSVAVLAQKQASMNLSQSIASLVDWVIKELGRMVDYLKDNSALEVKMDKHLENACYILYRLAAFRVPARVIEARAPGSPMSGGRHFSPNGASPLARDTAATINIHQEDENLIEELQEMQYSEDDLDNAVDNVLRRENSSSCFSVSNNSLVPPDDIATKSMSVSFWVNIDDALAQQRSVATSEQECWALLSRCQRREEDDGPSSSNHPVLKSCDSHSVVMHPAFLLRRDEKGSLFVDMLVSTIVLEDGLRTTLIEHISAPLRQCQEWFHVLGSVDSKRNQDGKRLLTLFVNGQQMAEKELRGQVLRKCSSSTPFRIGGLLGSRDFALAKAERCPNATSCALDAYTKILANGAPARLSDVLWHTSSLGLDEADFLFQAGRAQDRHNRRAASETLTFRCLEVLQVLCNTPQAITNFHREEQTKTMLELVHVSRWAQVQHAALNVVGTLLELPGWTNEEDNTCTAVENDLVGIFQKIWFDGSQESKHICHTCCADSSESISTFNSNSLSGYDPSFRGVLFKRYARLLRGRTLANARLRVKESTLCEMCSFSPNEGFDQQVQLLMFQHRFALQQDIVMFFRKHPQLISDTVAQCEPLWLLINGGTVQGIDKGSAALVPPQADSSTFSVDAPTSLEPARGTVDQLHQQQVGKVVEFFDAARLLRTYCVQKHYNYMECHSRSFSSQSDLLLYDFLIPDEAALAALRVAKMEGFFAAAEASSPRSPSSPGARHPTDTKSGTLWAIYGTKLVRETDLLEESEKQALLTIDFDLFCSKYSSNKSAPGQAFGALDGSVQHQGLGPVGWNLHKIAKLHVDSHDGVFEETRWAVCAELCPLEERVEPPEPSFKDIERLIRLATEGVEEMSEGVSPVKEILGPKQLLLVNAKTNTSRRALGAIMKLLAKASTHEASWVLIKAHEQQLLEVFQAFLRASTQDKSVLTKKLVKKFGPKLLGSSSVKSLLLLLSSSKSISPRSLEVAAERVWERIQTDTGFYASENRSTDGRGRSARNRTVGTYNNEPTSPSLSVVSEDQSDMAPASQRLILEAIGGDVLTDQVSFRVQGVGNLSSIRLRARGADSHLGPIALQSGKWYYEVVLMTDEIIQIGWADAAYRGDPINGRGVGDHKNSWAFDGYRGKAWNKDSKTYGLDTPWQVGDIVGCMLDMDAREISFTINGEALGVAFAGFEFENGLFPAISFGMGQSARLVFDKFNFDPPEGFLSIYESLLGSESSTAGANGSGDGQAEGKAESDELQAEISELEKEMLSLEESLEQHAQAQEQASYSTRQRVVDALLSTGLPLEWCQRAVDHVAAASATSGGTFDENAAVAWIMEEMLKDGSMSMLLNMVNNKEEKKDEAKQEESTDSGDAGHAASALHQLLFEEAGERPFNNYVPNRLLSQRMETPPTGISRSRLLAYGTNTGASRSFVHGVGTRPLSVSAAMEMFKSGDSSSGQSSEEELLLQITNQSRSEELPLVAALLDSMLSIEYTRSSLLGMLHIFHESQSVHQLFEEDPNQLVQFLRLALFRGSTCFDFATRVSQPIGTLTDGEVVVSRFLTNAYKHNAESAVAKSLLEGALDHLRQASTRPFDQVLWGSDSFLKENGPSVGTVMSRRMVSPPVDGGYFASLNSLRFWKSMDLRKGVFIANGLNGFSHQCDLRLSDTEALTQPNVEWATFILATLMNAEEARASTESPMEGSVFHVDVLKELFKLSCSPNLPLKDALFRLSARILTHVRKLSCSPAVKEQYAQVVPEALLLNLFATRFQKERPNTVQYSSYLRSLTALLVATRRLRECMLSRDTSSPVGAATGEQKLELFVSSLYSNSVTLKWCHLPHKTKTKASSLVSSRSIGSSDAQHLSGRRPSESEIDEPVADEMDDVQPRRGGRQLNRQNSMESNFSTASGTESQRDERESVHSAHMSVHSGEPRLEFEEDLSSHVLVLEYALGHLSLSHAGNLHDISNSFDSYMPAQDESALHWRVLAELPADAGTNEYICENLEPDTPYRFRLGLRTTKTSNTPDSKTFWGPVRSVSTPVVPVLRLSSHACGPNLELSNNNLTVKNLQNKRWNAVRTISGFSRGVHTWSVRIDRCISKNIFIGVVASQGATNNYVGSDRFGWGFLANKAVWHNRGKVKSYGELYREGDVVTVTLDCDAGTIAFARNGQDFGVAADGLDEFSELFPAVSLYNKDDQVSIIANNSVPAYLLSTPQEGHFEVRGTAFGMTKIGRLSEALSVIESLQSRATEEVLPLPRETVQRVAVLLEHWKHGELSTATPRGKFHIFPGESCKPSLLRTDLVSHSPWGQMDETFDHVLTSEGAGQIAGISNDGRLYYHLPGESVQDFWRSQMDMDASHSPVQALKLFGQHERDAVVPWNSVNCSLIRGAESVSEGNSAAPTLATHPSRSTRRRHSRSFTLANSRGATDDSDVPALIGLDEIHAIDQQTLHRAKSMVPGTQSKRQPEVSEVGMEQVEEEGEEENDMDASKEGNGVEDAADIDALSARLESFTLAGDRDLVAFLNELCLSRGLSYRQLTYDDIPAPAVHQFKSLAGIPSERLKERVALLIHLNNLLQDVWHFLELDLPVWDCELSSQVPKQAMHPLQNALSQQSNLNWSPGQIVLGSSDLVFLDNKVSMMFALAPPAEEKASLWQRSVRLDLDYGTELNGSILHQFQTLRYCPSVVEAVQQGQLLEGGTALHAVITTACCEALDFGLFVRQVNGHRGLQLGCEIEDYSLVEAFGAVIGLAMVNGMKLSESFRLPAPLLSALCGNTTVMEEKSSSENELMVRMAKHLSRGLWRMIPQSILFSLSTADELAHILYGI